MSNIKYLGRKFIIKDRKDLHPSFKNQEFCLLGVGSCAIACIEWDKRGDYDFEFINLRLEDIEFVEGKR